MRVLMLSLGYPPTIGGAEAAAARLAKGLLDRGHDVQVITGGDDDERRLHDGVPVESVHLPQRGSGFGFVRRVLRRAIRLPRADVIHAHSATAPAMAGLLLSRLWRRPLIVKPTSGRATGNLGDVERRVFGRLRVALLRRFTSCFVAVSEEIRAQLVDTWRIPAERVVCIPNGIDLELYGHRAARADPEGPTRYLYVGRLEAAKGVDVLLESWSLAGEPGLLTVVGDGPLRGELARGCPPSVRFVGAVPDPRPYLNESDVFVLPSRREGFSNALIEAAAAGLSLVATDVGSARRVIGDNGILVPPGDADALATAILAEPTKPIPIEELFDYSIDRVAESYEALYRGLIAPHA